MPPYLVRLHPKAERRLRKNPALRRLWVGRLAALAKSPRTGEGIRHLRNVLSCNYRLRLDVWRFLYEVDDTTREVRVYRATLRDDAYGP